MQTQDAKQKKTEQMSSHKKTRQKRVFLCSVIRLSKPD